MNQACYGYRDTETTASHDDSPDPRTGELKITRLGPQIPDPESLLQQLRGGGDQGNPKVAAFREHFYRRRASIFDNFEQHEGVQALMGACSLLLEANGEANYEKSTKAMELYVGALSWVHAAVRDQQRAREDATLVATILLCFFEV